MKFIVVISLSTLSTLTFAHSRVIYGLDNRQEVRSYNNPRVVEISRATVALVRSSRLTQSGASFNLDKTTFKKKMNLCSSERFGKQPAAAHCSGFLVAPNKIMTAGHCIESLEDCADVRFLFDYRMTSSTKAQLKFRPEQIYQCKSILGWALSSGGSDFAVIELDRPVVGRTPLKLSSNQSLAAGDDVTVIGHPSGLPTKISDGATVRSISNELGFFVANLDTYGGNSGSAVINSRTLEVEGILVRGEEDFVESPKTGCRRSFEVANDAGRGEDVTLISVVSENGAPPQRDFFELMDGFKAP